MIGPFLYHIPHQTPLPALMPPKISSLTILTSRFITGIFLSVFDPSFAVLTLVFFRSRPLIRVRCSIENKRLTLSTHKFLYLTIQYQPPPPLFIKLSMTTHISGPIYSTKDLFKQLHSHNQDQDAPTTFSTTLKQSSTELDCFISLPHSPLTRKRPKHNIPQDSR